MPDKEMELLLEIRAQGEQALRELRDTRKGVSSISIATARMGKVSRAAFKGMARAAKIALAPLKLAAGVVTGLGTTLLALGGKAVFVAGDIEALRLRLQAVTATGEQANEVFRETMRLSVTSPFEPEEMVNARIGLMNIGLVGSRALISVGNAASITQKPLEDLVSVVAALEAEPLRRLGIEASREAGKFEFTFRDQLQTIRTIRAEGINEARGALLDVFDIKFGGGMERFAQAWKGIVSTLRGNVRLAMSQFGEGLMPGAKRFVGFLNEKLTALMESGRLYEWADIALQKIVNAGNWIVDSFKLGVEIFNDLQNQGPGAMLEGFRIVFTTSARILVTSIVGYLKAASRVFIGVGKMIGAALVESVLASPLPGMGFARTRAASSARMDAERKIHPEATDRQLKRIVDFDVGQMSEEEKAQIAGARGRERAVALFESGMKDMTEEIPSIVMGAVAEVEQARDQLRASMQGITTIDVGTLLRSVPARF